MIRSFRSSITFDLLDLLTDSPLIRVSARKKVVLTIARERFKAFATSAYLTPVVNYPRINPLIYRVNSLRRMIFGVIGPNGLRGMVQWHVELKLF